MKTKHIKPIAWILTLTALIGMGSCTKYNSMGFIPGKGAPVITSVHTYNKYDTSIITTTISTMDSSGNISSTIRNRTGNPVPFDSITNAGNLGNYYLIEGSNLGSATSITFNGQIAYFNRGLITDHSILVAIPLQTPYYGTQATDSLVVTTLYGKAYYKFAIIAPPPTVKSVSDYNFSDGSQISFTGVGFASIQSVGFTGSSATCTIVSQTDTTMVLQFPSTNVSQANLVFNYSSAGKSDTVHSAQQFVDIDNAYQIFTNNNLQNGWGDNSWTKASPDISNAESKSGTSSFVMVFPQGNWQVEGFANYSPGVPYSPDYQYLSFWVKGGSYTETVYIQSNAAKGWGQNFINPIQVPAGVWTYFKIPLSSLGLTGWTASQPLQSIGFFIQGPNNATETYYFDDVILIKQ